MTFTEVVAALQTERDYQVRRWGSRTGRGGAMKDTPHSVAEFVLYMQDYYQEARSRACREVCDADRTEALVVLRKVIALGIACLEQHETEPLASRMDNLCAVLIRGSRIISRPTSGSMSEFAEYLLKIAACLAKAAKHNVRYTTVSGRRAHTQEARALCCIRDLIQVGIECFLVYGIESRKLPQHVINARDGQPA